MISAAITAPLLVATVAPFLGGLLNAAAVDAFRGGLPSSWRPRPLMPMHPRTGDAAGRCSSKLYATSDPTTRRECLSLLTSATKAATTAPALAVVASVLTPHPLPALAINDEDDDDAGSISLKYNGVYTDSNHPKGYRVLIGNGKRATVELQDDPNGEVYRLPVKVETSSSSEEGEEGEVTQFLFDFGPKGGPNGIVGVFTKDREGIPIVTFSDGNTWKKRETGPVGVYSDGLDREKLYVIRQFKGPELRVDIVAEGKDTTTIRAKAGNPTIVFDFPGTGPVPGVANLKRKVISFEDGNVWKKF